MSPQNDLYQVLLELHPIAPTYWEPRSGTVRKILDDRTGTLQRGGCQTHGALGELKPISEKTSKM